MRRWNPRGSVDARRPLPGGCGGGGYQGKSQNAGDGRLDGLTDGVKVALRFSGVNFVSLDFTDYVGMALCMGDNRVGDTSG
jgi:hypothetical protein